MSKKGFIFDIQKFSLHDGPGIRTIVFMKGCPLSCIWCSNPESQNTYSEIAFYSDNCINCKRCIKACSKNAIIDTEEGRFIEREFCKECNLKPCVDACNFDAIKLIGRYVTVEEIMKEIKKDEVFYMNFGGGGITVSGGEPLFQADFVSILLKKAKEMGYDTAIETSGYCNWQDFEKVINYTDLFFYDIKHMNEKIHIKGTGVSNTLILKNLKVLLKKAKRVIVRIPIIPKFNDNDENIKETCIFLQEIGFKEEINLLPYHNLGESKYKKIGKRYKLHDLKCPGDNKIKHLKEIIEYYGFNCQIGG